MLLSQLVFSSTLLLFIVLIHILYCIVLYYSDLEHFCGFYAIQNKLSNLLSNIVSVSLRNPVASSNVHLNACFLSLHCSPRFCPIQHCWPDHCCVDVPLPFHWRTFIEQYFTAFLPTSPTCLHSYRDLRFKTPCPSILLPSYVNKMSNWFKFLPYCCHSLHCMVNFNLGQIFSDQYLYIFRSSFYDNFSSHYSYHSYLY